MNTEQVVRFWLPRATCIPYIRTSCSVLLGKKLLHVLDEFGQLLTVFGYTADLLLVEIRLDLFAQQYLADNISYVRRSGPVFCIQTRKKSHNMTITLTLLLFKYVYVAKGGRELSRINVLFNIKLYLTSLVWHIRFVVSMIAQ